MKLFSLSLLALLCAQTSFGFGGKKMQLSELKGVTETQVAADQNGATVFLRGKAAELVFRTMQEQEQAQTNSAALQLVNKKDATHVAITGKQVSCSKIARENKKAYDYACSFFVSQNGEISVAGEAFNPAAFNLARTETGSKLFPKKAQSRTLASVAPAFSKGQAYLVYDKPGKRLKSETALIVIRGASAKEILGLLGSNSKNKSETWGAAQGTKGKEIACVAATEKESERCAVVVSFRDGTITRSGNPLY